MNSKISILALLSILFLASFAYALPVTVTRDLPDSTQINNEFNVTLNAVVDAQNAPSGYIVAENYPAGMQVIDAGGASHNATTRKLTWLNFGTPATSQLFSYRLKALTAGTKTFSGTVLNNEDWVERSIAGDTQMTVYETSPCTPSWSCTGWSPSTCPANGQQTRTCTDSNQCGTNEGKPNETQSCIPSCSTLGGNICTQSQVCNGGSYQTASDTNYCCVGGICQTPPCIESWTCTAWSSCSNWQQTRTCTDSNQCGTTNNKPAETQDCLMKCSDNTVWSQCSLNKPLYCNQGSLINSCATCGCPSQSDICEADGSCTPTAPVCAEGQITQKCSCGGYIVSAGYCCGSTYQQNSCGDIYVARDLPVSAAPSSHVCINLMVQVNEAKRPLQYTLKDTVPAGFTFVQGGQCGGTGSYSGNTVQWFKRNSAVVDGVLVYEVITPSTPGTYAFSGILNYYDSANKYFTKAVGGDLNLIVSGDGCTPSWSCTAWSACSNGAQTRTCTDSNQCGTNEGKPAEAQGCGYPITTLSYGMLDENMTSLNQPFVLTKNKMYHVKVKNKNTAQSTLQSMRIVQISTNSGTPLFIGTVKSNIDAGQEPEVTVGFIAPSIAGTYKVKILNWNDWVNNGTPTILAEPVEFTFTVN